MNAISNPESKLKSYNPALIKAAHLIGGIQKIADICGVRTSAAWRWFQRGHLPRTEWTGETRYAELIEAATQSAVTKAELLAHAPKRVSRILTATQTH